MAKIVRCWQTHLPEKLKDYIVTTVHDTEYSTPWEMFLNEFNAKSWPRMGAGNRLRQHGDWFEIDESEFLLLLMKYS